MGCRPSREEKNNLGPSHEEFSRLASETPFSRSDVESLYELYKKLSASVVQDGYIRKEDLHFALFRSSNKRNLFVDRMFDLFDVDDNGQIEFSEFVRSLSVFHPKTPEPVKIKYAFKLYDLRCTGFIEREELEEMVLAILTESDLKLSNDAVETIVDKTFMAADTKGDGKIDTEEWKQYAEDNPSLLKNMTLPYLMDISVAFPSFLMSSETEESQL